MAKLAGFSSLRKSINFLRHASQVINDDGEIKGKVEVTKSVDVIESG